MERQRPTPLNSMRLKRPDLTLSAAQSQRGFAEDPTRPRRYRASDAVWADTGLLCALGARPVLLERFLQRYGSTLRIAHAVKIEIERKARSGGADLMRSCAQVIADKIRYGDIPVDSLSEDALDDFGGILAQLEDADSGVDASAPDVGRAQRHAGEAESITGAVQVTRSGCTALLLTDDGGASRVAKVHGIPCRNICDVLRELGCEDPGLVPDRLFRDYESMTAQFATLPKNARPGGAADFTCWNIGGVCEPCDKLSG